MKGEEERLAERRIERGICWSLLEETTVEERQCSVRHDGKTSVLEVEETPHDGGS